jgi:hypothetical protein
MTGFVRRIVTGHDKSGKAIVISDGYTPVVKTDPARPGYRGTDVWKTFAMPAPITADEANPTLGPRPLLPAPNGTTIRISLLRDAEFIGERLLRKVLLLAQFGDARAERFKKLCFVGVTGGINSDCRDISITRSVLFRKIMVNRADCTFMSGE